MSARTKYILAGSAAGIVVLALFPGWLMLLIVLGVVAVPAVAYLLLDPAQRRRLHRIRHKQLGR